MGYSRVSTEVIYRALAGGGGGRRLAPGTLDDDDDGQDVCTCPIRAGRKSVPINSRSEFIPSVPAIYHINYFIVPGNVPRGTNGREGEGGRREDM